MIENLSVRNFALIKEAHIDFKDGLNVLTGETGSGKSILLGSLNLALGMRANKDVIRDDNDETSVTMSFNVTDNDLLEYFKSLDINIDDGRIVIYRKISHDKNVVKINDEPCTLLKLRSVTERLIDVYGQHDGEDLRKNSKHIEFLDTFIGEDVIKVKKEILKYYDELNEIDKKLSSFNLDERMKLREIDLLKYEIEELTNANIKDGEEEDLTDKFKVASGAKNIIQNLSAAIDLLQNSDLSKALRELKDACKIDNSLDNIYSSLVDADSIISDSIKELDKKMDSYDVDEKELKNMEDRLDQIRSILSKYNNSLETANSELKAKSERLEVLNNYDLEKEKTEAHYQKCKDNLYKAANKLSEIRNKYKQAFEEKIIDELRDLGFLDIKFNISIDKKTEVTKDGIDDVVFYVSLNTGEKLKPLSEIASGGELSRIMLSIKTVLSNNYGTETLVFDEIDSGISGITASKVATKLNKIARNHQVILITHLPQIAAMADSHYVIEKKVNDGRTITSINELDNDGMINEIGRLISSSGELTDKVIANARELKESAMSEKIV